MEYILTLDKQQRDSGIIRNVTSWEEVKNILKDGLDQWTYCVTISKFAADGRLLGSKNVTMSNIMDVCQSKSDKVLK